MLSVTSDSGSGNEKNDFSFFVVRQFLLRTSLMPVKQVIWIMYNSWREMAWMFVEQTAKAGR